MMRHTDTTERGLESLIVSHMNSEAGGWYAGDPGDYDEWHCRAFLRF